MLARRNGSKLPPGKGCHRKSVLPLSKYPGLDREWMDPVDRRAVKTVGTSSTHSEESSSSQRYTALPTVEQASPLWLLIEALVWPPPLLPLTAVPVLICWRN
jgi:hypothetical protein